MNSNSNSLITRRSAVSLLAGRQEELIGSIETRLLWEGKRARTCWFHPKIARARKSLLMTVQLLTASDVMHQPHYSESFDEGKTWTERRPIPALERRVLGGGFEDVVSDVVPEYHAPSDTVLCLGQDVHYKDEVLIRQGEDRWIRYFVRRADGTWTVPRRLEFAHPEASMLMSAGCSQRVTLRNGNLIMPVTMKAARQDHTVSTLLCTFDGTDLKAVRLGNILKLPVKRGLMEPSLTQFDGQYWLTIRAEDERGHFAVSKDGLSWGEVKTHQFDDGTTLITSTTQQHWVTHSSGLYLAYTRKDAVNEKIFRWRTPTYLARFDTKRQVIVKSSEVVLVPKDGEAMHGNFHVTNISPRETLVSLGDIIVDKPFRGDTMLTSIRWTKDNQLARTNR